MDFWKSIAGLLTVELTSAEPETALTAVNMAGIEISKIQQTGNLTCCFLIRRKDFSKLQKLCKKRGETLRILKKTGIFWTMRSALSRPILLGGIAFIMSLVLYLPSRVFFVRVEGNESIPTRKILMAAEECGIRFGTSRRAVRSEKVKNALLAAVPELQWAGVNTSGCVATISVRERTAPEVLDGKKEVTNIVASRDGFILSGTVTQGNGVFQVGQTVEEGQILISGYTDCGLCIRATRSEGEIFAQTERKMDVAAPSNYITRGETIEVKRKISLLVRKKRINLWKDSGISDTSCGRMYEEYYITLPGGFQLPVALCLEEFYFYKTQNADISQTDAEDSLSSFAESYLAQQMVAGEIRDKSETVTLEDGIYRLTGAYVCVEMIGREQQEQIGDTNGKIG